MWDTVAVSALSLALTRVSIALKTAAARPHTCARTGANLRDAGMRAGANAY